MANNLIKDMKDRIARSGANKKEIIYFAPDSVKRIRFLEELDEGKMFQFHSDYEAHIFELCKDPEDHENCSLCNDDISILEQYAWSVWDYDSNAVRILCTKATGVSPIPALIELYEEYGTLKDRDIKIKKVGKGVGSSFTVTPLDKSRFRNEKAKPYTEKQLRDIFLKAYVSNSDSNEEEDEEEEVKETKKKTTKKKEKKEPTLREKYEELTFSELKNICLEIGMSKKEIKAFEDEEEILDELFDNYEEEDLEELLEQDEEDEDDEE